MVRVALGGRGSAVRSMGVRIHTEMGQAGEAIMVELIGPGAEWVGSRRYASWRGSPPIDVIDHNRGIAYQVKTISEPKLGDIAFSGAHREVAGRSSAGLVYTGTEQDKLDRIQEWVDAHGWQAWKIVMLVDEETGLVTVYGKRGVTNAGIREMDPIAGFNSNTGEWQRIPGTPDDEYPPGIPDHALLVAGFPSVPEYLRSGGSDAEAQARIAQMGMFRREVHVRGHRRRV